MITVNNVTYWMGTDRFYMYNGTVSTLPCALKQYVFDDINASQSYQVFAANNEGFNEVWWFYVSQSSGGTTIDKYVVYNYLDNAWYYGTMGRTAWIQSGILSPLGKPLAADYNSRLIQHEIGTDDLSTGVSVPINSYVVSSDIELSVEGSGEHFGFVWRMLPDVNFNGSTVANPAVNIALIPKQNSGASFAQLSNGPYWPAQGQASSNGVWPPSNQVQNPFVQSSNNYSVNPEYTIQQFTGQVYTRVRGRQMTFKIGSNTLGVAWQLGTPRFDIRPDGRRAG
jgi:hypothetical protein